jgi:hypothetical protein
VDERHHHPRTGTAGRRRHDDGGGVHAAIPAALRGFAGADVR